MGVTAAATPRGTRPFPALVAGGSRPLDGHRLHSYSPDPRADSYGADTADALGLAPQLVVGVVPVSAQLDLRALAAATIAT